MAAPCSYHLLADPLSCSNDCVMHVLPANIGDLYSLYGGIEVLPRIFARAEPEKHRDVADALLWVARFWISFKSPRAVWLEIEQQIKDLKAGNSVGPLQWRRLSRGVNHYHVVDVPKSSTTSMCLYHERKYGLQGHCPENCCFRRLFTPDYNAAAFATIFFVFGGREIIPGFFDNLPPSFFDNWTPSEIAASLMWDAHCWTVCRIGGPKELIFDLEKERDSIVLEEHSDEDEEHDDEDEEHDEEHDDEDEDVNDEGFFDDY